MFVGSRSCYQVTVTNNCDPPVEVQPAAAVVETPRFIG
jgi:hypothetical protein